MRLMGNRMSSTLGRNELAAMVVLAAGIGMPILTPERGLLPAFIISGIVVLTERGISALAVKKQSFEKISQGDISILIEDAVLNIEAMNDVRVSREKLLSVLRSKGIRHLGMVKRLYIEANGEFSLTRNKEHTPGLCCIPEWDMDFYSEQPKADVTVCRNCGNKQQDTAQCGHCRSNDWVLAVQ